MSTEFDEQNHAVNGHVEESTYEENEHNTHYEAENEPEIHTDETPSSPINQTVQEDESRSRHSSTCSSAADECHEPVAPVEETRHVVESNEEEPEVKQIDENRNEEAEPKKVRPLLQRDFTQQSVVKKEPLDDWAKEHIGKSSHTKSLIAKFNSGVVLNEQANNTKGTYKTDYGVGQGKGQLKQDVFH